ncbi:MAG: hypothetical protein JWM58_2435 [Rhizobium sp.]|nr:hypothetical protein [Rhizobium sp.]
MLKYALLIGLVLPVSASAADYIQGSDGLREERGCPSEQNGNHYCIDAPPVEKVTTDCEPGMNCTHMQSGQHYSIQSPVRHDY